MKKYNTRPINFTGCHPVIAEHLKRCEEIRCWVWDQDSHDKPTHCSNEAWIVRYWAAADYPYRTATDSFFRHAEPIPIKTRRVMPLERAIPILIKGGWKFYPSGKMYGPKPAILPAMLCRFGTNLDDPNTISWRWPDCIIEEVEDE